MVPMADRRQVKRLIYAAVMLAGAVLWLAALLLLSQTAQNSAEFSRLQPAILAVNAAGALVLLLLIGGNLVRLIRDYRRQVPGSRLKARMVTMLLVLSVLPLVLVYLFAVQFINRGIDSWFNVDVEQGLSDALSLSQTALAIQMREHLEDTQAMNEQVSNLQAVDLISQLGALRRESGARELSVFGANSQIMATSSDNPTAAVPDYPSEELIFQLRQGRPFVALEPLGRAQFQIRTAISLDSRSPGAEPRVLQGIFGVDQQLSGLAEQVQASFNQYAELAFLRNALKTSFTLTLSLVLLLALLMAVYGAFFTARRLVSPIQQLVAGTRAVAKGDFDTRLPMPARDEIGFLVNSFNDMTKRLAMAHQEARRSQAQVESERAKLAVILARLSTGVVALESDLSIRTANQAAGAILGVDLESRVGESLVAVARDQPLLEQFLAVSHGHLEGGESEWREQIVLRGEVGRRVLMCACTALPGEGDETGGYVVVFDDITALLQAQRDAAWGEVARRLAHEIKNPLTPIQLSAERLRRKFVPAGRRSDDALVDRATHTIIQQVEAMKDMVNAFSEYARAPDIQISSVDLNQLISEVAELYRHQQRPLSLNLSLDSALPLVKADVGRMRQVLHNLIRNALEALEGVGEPRIDITTRYASQNEEELAEIQVADNGPGFQAEIVEQAFDPYVTSKAKGTGLGLAIVKKLVEEHGGTIQARNAERGGAEISILLPVEGRVSATATIIQSARENRRERA
jgi:nitrogen fixation/metabolism regulation signal transduction histidine kinase